MWHTIERFVVALALLAFPCAAMPPEDMETVIENYEADLQSVSRFFDLPGSVMRFGRLDRLQHDWQGKLSRIEFDPLDQHGRVDWLLLRTKLAAELDDQALNRGRSTAIADFLPFRADIQALEEARWRLEPIDAQASAATLAKLPDQIKALRERLEQGKKDAGTDKKTEEKKKPDNAKKVGDAKNADDSRKPDDAKKADDAKNADTAAAGSASKGVLKPLKMSASLAVRTARGVDSLRQTLRTWFTFYDGFTPEFSWWVRKPHEAADKSLEDYAKFLREEIASQRGKDEDPLVGDPVTEVGLVNLLKGEMIAYSPQEVVTIGERELARCEEELKKAAREMGMGDNWKAAMAKVKSAFEPPGQQDDLVARQAREVIRFVKDRDLLNIPPLCEETWRLTMTSPDYQKRMPFAAYVGQAMTVSYANESMKHEDKLMSMRGNNRHFSRIVTPHELIPGHHLERFHSVRNRPYRQLFDTPFFVEGWGLYWEFRLWDLGYARSPEDRIGMLFWRLNRSARIIVSFKYHLGQMKPSEMVDFLVERVGHERFGATSEVRRYMEYSPLYQAAYMVGGLQLYSLYKEVVGGGKMTDKAFHDAVLAGNAIPIEMVRAEVLNLPLSRDQAPRWRFADPLSSKP